MKRVVSLLHRQAVRAKAEGLFFQVSRRRRLCDWCPGVGLCVLITWPGIHPEPVQDHSRGPEIVSQRTALQGSSSAH